MTEILELTTKDLTRAIPARVWRRLMLGQIQSGQDISALRRFIGLTQAQFARAMAISVHTLRNWQHGRRHPDGPALALL
jgi:DNA-binding transcriptional regulator YiaG